MPVIPEYRALLIRSVWVVFIGKIDSIPYQLTKGLEVTLNIPSPSMPVYSGVTWTVVRRVVEFNLKQIFQPQQHSL